MVETWWPVVGWEGMYSVSDHGRIWSHPRTVQYVRHGRCRDLFIPGRIIGGSVVDGHVQITLAPHGAGRRERVVRFAHHLVLEAFVGFCPAGMEACHHNDIGTDNRLPNLRWDTRSSNIRDRIRLKEGTNA